MNFGAVITKAFEGDTAGAAIPVIPPHIVRGADLRAFAARCLRVFDQIRGPHYGEYFYATRALPDFLRIEHYADHRGVSGRAGAYSAVVKHGDCTVAEVLEVTMHEMLHVYLDSVFFFSTPRDKRGPRPAHGVVFQETLCAAARIMWDIDIDRRSAKGACRVLQKTTWLKPDNTVSHVTERKEIRAYALDRLIFTELQNRLDSGALTLDYVVTGR